MNALDEAIGLLACAESQAIPSDDQIIVGHIRDSLSLLREYRKTDERRMPEWSPISALPSPGRRPGRLLVVVEGSTEHSGANWTRKSIGVAATIRDGFSPDDIAHIEAAGDMDAGTGRVTHWLPMSVLPPIPDKPFVC